jgi:hypothetical protein
MRFAFNIPIILGGECGLGDGAEVLDSLNIRKVITDESIFHDFFTVKGLQGES